MFGEVGNQRGERCRPGGGVEPDEPDDEQHEPDVHHDEVRQGRAPDLAPLGVEKNQDERSDGHQLPEEEERIAAVGSHDAQHGERHDGQGGIVERDVGRGLAVEGVAQITARIEHGGHGADSDEEHEERRQRVERPAVAPQHQAVECPERPGLTVGQHAHGAGRERDGSGSGESQRRPDLGPERGGADGRRDACEGEKGVEEEHLLRGESLLFNA